MRAAVSASLYTVFTPTAKLAASTMGMRFAASEMRLLSSGLKPVVPITIALACLRSATVPSGRVKSSTTSAWATAAASETIFTLPTLSPAAAASNAHTMENSGSADAASAIARPMRPAAPAMASFTWRSLRGAGGAWIAIETRELAVLEVDGEFALLALRTGLIPPVHVIPAVGMEDVGEKRRAERQAYLLLAHARLQGCNRFRRDVIALLDFDAIGLHAGNLRDEAAARDGENEEQQEPALHGRI